MTLRRGIGQPVGSRRSALGLTAPGQDDPGQDEQRQDEQRQDELGFTALGRSVRGVAARRLAVLRLVVQRLAGLAGLVALPALLPLLAACRGPEPPLAPGGTAVSAAPVVAADGVLCDLVRRLAAADQPVVCLLRAGDDPHNLRLTPTQRQALATASRVLVNGYGLTPALARLNGAVPVAERAVPDSPRLDPAAAAPPAGAGAHGQGHSQDTGHSHGDSQDSHGHGQDTGHSQETGHSHGPSEGRHSHASDRDPHVWHDPIQAAAMVQTVAAELIRQRPAASAAVQRRADRLRGLLVELDRWNRVQLATIPRRDRGRIPPLATAHRSAASYARRYGLGELPLVDALSSSSTLRPQSIAQVVAELRRRQVPRLFAEPPGPTRTLQRLSELSGVPIGEEALVVDGLAGGAGGEQSLMATLVANTCRITTGLGGRCDQRSGAELVRRWESVAAGA